MRFLVRLGAVFALLCALAFGQNARYDNFAWSTFPQGATSFLIAAPGARITVCNYPAVGFPCTNTATLYTGPSSVTAASASFNADYRGNFGFWAAPGSYQYTIQVGNTFYGPYNAILAPVNGSNATFNNLTILGTCTGACGGGGGGAVNFVFGRQGTVVAQSGDYLASQVTNAADTTQTYSNPSWITSLAWAKLTGYPTVNGHSIGSNVTVTASDVNAFDLTNNNNIGTHYIDLGGIATPANPAAGFARFYNKTGSGACELLAGVETCFGSGGGGAVSSLTGDNVIFNNSGSTGAVTLTPAQFSAHFVYANNSGSTATPGAVRLACADLSNAANSCSVDATNAANINAGTLPNARLSAVPNASLANSSTTVSGQSCVLGGSCTVTAAGVTNAYDTSTNQSIGTHFASYNEVAVSNGGSTTTWNCGMDSTAHQFSCKNSAGTQGVPSGFTNPLTTLGDVMYGGAGGAATRLAGPTGVNGVPQTLVSTPAAGAATAVVWSPSGIPTNAQTGTTYTVVATDRASYVTFSNASAVAVTLPQAGTTGFANNFVFSACAIGAGTVTITPTTSTVSYATGNSYVSGASSLSLGTGNCAWIYSDNTNYFSIVRNANATQINGTTFAGTNGDLVSFGAANVPADSSIVAANVITDSTNLTSGHIPKANGSKTVTDGYTVQGTDTSLLSSGTVSGTGATLCTDANGGATTSGCTGGSGYSTIDSNGSAITQRATVNFISGSNATVACVDNAGSTRSDCTISASSSAGSRLDQITAATAGNSFNSADNAQVWNWSVTTASKSAFTFGENVASTATGTPFLLNVATLAASTLNPLQVTARGTANGIRVDAATGSLSPIGTANINATQVNGAAPSTSSAYAATNGSGQIVAATTPVTSMSGTSNEISMSASTGAVTASLATAARTRQCEVVWGGTGASNVLQSGDDGIANNSCFNKTGVAWTVTAVYCMADIASNTVTVAPVFGSAGSGTSILTGALTCGSSSAYSSTGTLSGTPSIADGNGINPVMGGTLNAHSIHMLVVYTMP